jgi:NAD(P)H-flavin reductase
MLNIIDSYLKLNMENLESIVLVNVNSNAEAIFGIEILEEYVSSSSGKFRYVNVVSSDVGDISSYEGLRVGKVDEELLRELMPLPNETSCAMVCGPPPFNSLCRKVLRDDLRHPEEGVKIF